MAPSDNTAGRNGDRLKSVTHITEIYSTIRTIVRCCAAVLAIYVFMQALAPFAGKNTAMSLAFSVLADVKFALTVTLAGAATAWAVVERTLRRQKTQYLQDRIIELETNIDAKRSSSNLTRTGKTNPKDRRS
ncbi:hypothetical protein ASG50_27895 [Rhizobium sp. Leaf386]|nr:hypothetical protein ASG50_27895 [Rhizobium sp. Leaf386]